MKHLLILFSAVAIAACADPPDQWVIDLPQTGPVTSTGNATCPADNIRMNLVIEDPFGIPYLKEEYNPFGLSCHRLPPEVVLCSGTTIGEDVATLWLNPLRAQYTYEFREQDTVTGSCTWDFGQ